MANRLYKQFPLTLVPQVVELFGRATIAAAGAPTLVLEDSIGLATLVRTGTGAYTLTLSDKYPALLDFDVHFKLASGTPVTIAHCLKTNPVDSTKVITFSTLDAAGAAADPDSGAELFLHIKLRNSSLKK